MMANHISVPWAGLRTGARRTEAEALAVLPARQGRGGPLLRPGCHPDWAATLGVTFIQVIDGRSELTPEEAWQGAFPEARLRMKRCAQWLGERGRRLRGS